MQPIFWLLCDPLLFVFAIVIYHKFRFCQINIVFIRFTLFLPLFPTIIIIYCNTVERDDYMGKYSDFSKERFAKMLAQYRIDCGLSQLDLAKKVGMSGPTISCYEAGERDPKCSVYVKLAEALGIDPIQFFINDNVLNLINNNDRLFSATDGSSYGQREQLISEMTLKLRGLSDHELHALNIVIDSMTGHGKLLFEARK